MNITFNGETATYTAPNGNHYHFLILGDGILPYGNKNLETTIYIRRYLKENYKEKLNEIKALNQHLEYSYLIQIRSNK